MTSAQRKLNATILWAQKSDAVINSLAKSLNIDSFKIKIMLYNPEFCQKVAWLDDEYTSLYDAIVKLKDPPKRERRSKEIDKIDNVSP